MQKRVQIISNVKNIPTREDWGDFSGDFDVSDAYENFFGKSNQEMRKCFSQNVMSRAQDIRFMPGIPFSYYIFGFCDFVLSKNYEGENTWDVADCFISVIKERAEKNPSVLLPIFEYIETALNFLVAHQEEFGADIEIYGDFEDASNLIKKAVIACGNSGGH
ncbi:hypothetical protein FNU76_16785 [Chitinimonas arctica]|uniref:Uncharacterized protein n=1 Tax=Chitinimonas arctica TaxID=2594795 RepID=A0A516SIJ9_9NEIS|nr:hypothetical protein [Chitinimonas arctica]QDQ27868.1 hypothetical protein FNU76_16785 [Chitinimonas arctica]